MPRLVVTLIAIAFSTPVQAQEACSGDFTPNDMITGMNVADAAYAEADVDRARAALDQIKSKLLCTRDFIHPNLLTRFARQEGMAFFLDQDDLTMQSWGIVAKVAGTAPWPAYLAEGHPFRSSMEEIEDPLIGSVDGGFLLVPKDGAVTLNGHFIDKPSAPAEATNFVQVFDKNGLVTKNYWQEGTVFSTTLLRGDDAPIVKPGWWTEPAADLDPTKPIQIDAAVAEARAAAQKAAAEEAAAREAQRKAALEKEAAKAAKVAERVEKKRAIEEKKAAKLEAKAAKVAEVVDTGPSRPPPPSEWAEFDFNDDRATLATSDVLERAGDGAQCSDLLAIEPRSLLGRLTESEILCLEQGLRHEAKQTMRDRISRVLMADAWAKNQPHRWEAAVRRHLTEIDRSDADLCYLFSRYLSRQGAESAAETIRWADLALENAEQWDGDVHTKRVFELYRIKAIAAQTKWYEREQAVTLNGTQKALIDEASAWRNTTKTLAREWLAFASASGQDEDAAEKLCVSAAGTKDYCLVK